MKTSATSSQSAILKARRFARPSQQPARSRPLVVPLEDFNQLAKLKNSSG
jgi:hypothetical protein